VPFAEIRRPSLLCISIVAIGVGCPGDRPQSVEAPVKKLEMVRVELPPHDVAFGRIAQLAAAQDGKLYVRDPDNAATISIYDSLGRPAGRIGRKGRGPGEFLRIGHVSFLNDTLVIHDGSAGSITLLDSRGRPLETVQSVNLAVSPSVPTPGGGVMIYDGMVSDGSVVMNIGLLAARDPAIDVYANTSLPVLKVPRAAFATDRLANARLDTLCIVHRPERKSFKLGNRPATPTNPWSEVTLAEISPNGKTFVCLDRTVTGRSDPVFVMSIRDSAGSVHRVEVPYRRVVITQADLDSAWDRFRNLMGERQPDWQSDAEMRAGFLRTVHRPAHMPPVTDLKVGSDGSIWVARAGSSPNVEWEIYEGKGKRIATAQLPRNFDVMTVLGTSAWGTETDANGEQHLVRYRIR
jgi:hypothetical protein